MHNPAPHSAAAAAVAPVAERVVYRPVRRKLPDERRSITHKFSIGGHEGYITVGMYDDGAPGEIFITMANWEPHEPLILRVGYLLDSGNRSGIGLVGRSPWTWGPLWGRRPRPPA